MRRSCLVPALVLAGAMVGSGAARAADDTLYGVFFTTATTTEGLVVVDPVTGGVAPIGAGIAGCCLVSSGVSTLDAAGDVFFFVGHYQADPPGVNRLFSLDLDTGALLGDPALTAGYNYNFIEHDPATATLYAVVHELATTSERLATLDPVTGALTTVGGAIAACCGVPSGTSALAPGDAFFFYGSRNDDALGQRLFSLDLATGALLADPVLPAGNNYNFLEYDPTSATVYGVVFETATTTERLVVIDAGTGALAPLGAGIAGCCLVPGGVSTIDPGDSFHFVGHYQADVGETDRIFTLALADGSLVGDPLLPVGSNENFLEFDPAPEPIEVVIDIKPGSFPNSVNPGNKGVVPVAVLTTPEFDAATVDPATARFGPAAAPIAHAHGHLEDVDGDGDVDLMLHFRTALTGIACGDTEAVLTAETFGGDPVFGSDSVNPVPCP